jgi:hypothetical protein
LEELCLVSSLATSHVFLNPSMSDLPYGKKLALKSPTYMHFGLLKNTNH